MTRVSMRAACLTIYGLSLCGLLLDARPHASQRPESSGAPASPSASYGGWTHYGGSPDQVRYSSLRQIDKTNVNQLTVAWTYDSQEAGGLQTQPIVVDGVLFGYTPTHKTFALRADTGALLWTFDSGIKGQGANRAVMYWSDGGDKRGLAPVD